MNLEQFGTWEKMSGGHWHLPGQTEQVRAEHARTFRLIKQFNDLGNTDQGKAREILRELLPEESHVPGWFGPANVEFGCNLIIGEHVFINFGATILAQAKVTLADHVMIGPRGH